MSFKFDLQIFAYTNDGDKYKFIDDESMVIEAKVDMRPYTYFAWMLENIEDLGTINSMSESTSAKKDYWNKDHKVSQLAAVFSTFIDSNISNLYEHGLPKKYEDLNNKYPDKKFVDIVYMNNAISHMKIQDGAILRGAFSSLGTNKNGRNDTELTTTNELDLTPLELEKAEDIACLISDSIMNVNVTNIKLNPKIKYLESTFAVQIGYVKGILDIDYSNIESATYFLPRKFYENKNLKAILGDTNKIIKFSKPPKNIKRLGDFLTVVDPASEQESEYILDLSNWNLESIEQVEGTSNYLISGVCCKEIIFPDGFVYTPKYDIQNLISTLSTKKITNLSIDFSKLNDRFNSPDEISYLNGAFVITDHQWSTSHLDSDCKIKFINFNETKFYSFYKDANNGYDGEEYTLETFYKDYIGLPKENIEFINKI